MALADNKAKIQALLDGINALPEAGSGEAPAPVLQEKSVTPTEEAQSVTPDAGYDGLSQVDVGAIPDEYIVPSGTVDITENGEHDVREAETVNVNVPTPEPVMQEKTVTPAATAQTVTADSGYDGLSSVSVGAISSTYVGSAVPRREQTVYVPEVEPILFGPGEYLEGIQYIMGEPNLLPENIKSGVSIFNTVGTYKGEGGGLPSGISALAAGTITPTESSSYLNVTHNLGVVPNFIVWMMEDDTSANVMTSVATVGATLIKNSKYTSTSAINYNVHNLISGYNSSSQQANTSTRVSNNTYMTTTTARMTASTTHYIKAGKTYRWVCGVLDGIA